MNKSAIDQIVAEATRHSKEYNSTIIKCGIIGLSGSGKSSLINAIAGKKIAKVGSTETTMEAQSYTNNGIEYVDLPGCGTQKWPQDTYIEKLALEKFDCFIIVTSNRLYESDIYLHKELKEKRNKPCFIVRNKIDCAIDDERRDNDTSEAATLEKVRADINSNISTPDENIYLTSTRHPTKWEFIRLMMDIIESQEGIKRDKITAGIAPISKEILAKKSEVGKKIVSWAAVASAANALNPIPGVDVAVDIGILVGMCQQLNQAYGLTEEQLDYFQKNNTKLKESAQFSGTKQAIMKWVAKYAVAEGILIALKAMGTRIAIKNVAKFLPFIGTIVSAGIGYKMTMAFGEAYLEEAESNAEKVLDLIIQNQ